MSKSSRKLSFSIYEDDEDCRAGNTGSSPSLNAAAGPGAGQTGLLTTQMPPPPLPPPPHSQTSPFMVRVPSGSSSSSLSSPSPSSSAASCTAAGLAGQTRLSTHLDPPCTRPFTVRVPSTSCTSSSSSSAYSGVGPTTGHVGLLHMAPRSTPTGPAGTRVARFGGEEEGGGRAVGFRVPSTGSSSSSGYLQTGSSSTGRSSISCAAGVARQPGSTSSIAHRSSGTNPVTTTSSAISSTTGSSSTDSVYPQIYGIPLFPIGGYTDPHDARGSEYPPLDKPEVINDDDGMEEQQQQTSTPLLLANDWERNASGSNTLAPDGVGEETVPLPDDGLESPDDGTHQQQEQLDTPVETPEARSFVDVYVEDWMRRVGRAG
ncbi:hypothetical protein VMCG_02826 [Cytospora schulzeri]|uniref:Uncharacterized protein n=1 Tax=Cytospora schulzeri TaxID=448051 RepID=A0A423WZ89_9PEZI|nr:hypothetical protein VMCG_02826 [Valsa malicola]